jgi:hypothetical protein
MVPLNICLWRYCGMDGSGLKLGNWNFELELEMVIVIVI